MQIEWRSDGFAYPRYNPPMLPAPIPDNDAQRLETLRRLLILDTPPEERFDRLVAFAAQEFGVPTALISLVDRNRQWFKARVGMAERETPRTSSFCGHALELPDVLVIRDSLLDDRFADNPLVTGPPYIRFYAGAQLRMPDGHVMGTLCLLAPEPRGYDAVDRAIHLALRDLVVEELLRREAE